MENLKKEVKITVDMQVYKDLIGQTEFDIDNVGELIVEMLNGDFEPNFSYALLKSPFYVESYYVTHIDKEWS